MAKEQYYRLDNILLTNAQWYLLIGQRANGKSYAVKEFCIKDYCENHHKFIYLRRFALDIKENYVTTYFDDAPVKDITKGEYIGVMAFHGSLYLYNLDADGKICKGEEIGRYCSLSEDARIKSQVFNDYYNIIYEEFIPVDNHYVENEPSRLQNMASSIFRRRKGRTFLIGNTLSRVSPYAQEWSIDFAHQKQGTIEVYNYHEQDDEEPIKVAVEYCATTNYKNKMFFGNAKKQILSGEWEVNQYPRLPKPLEEYEDVYTMLIEYQNFKFILKLLVDSEHGGKICYIYPSTRDFKGFRVLTDNFSDNPFISARLDISRTPERYIKECFALNKLCFSDNLTGTDFKNINEHFHIAQMF